MPKTFAQHAAERAAEAGPPALTAARVFDATYAVGAALSSARHACNLTQAQLAQRSGVSQADISRIERGLLAPTTPTYVRLVTAMGGQLTVVLPADVDPEAHARHAVTVRSQAHV